VGKIAEKAVYKSVFLTKWHCNLSAKLTKRSAPSDCCFSDFAHWAITACD